MYLYDEMQWEDNMKQKRGSINVNSIKSTKIYDKLTALIRKVRIPKYFRTIRFKLSITVILPIALIFILGIVSTNIASDNIIDNYVKSTSKAINMAGDYLHFGLEGVEATAKQYANDDNIKKYFVNYYEGDIVEKNKVYKNISNLFQAKKMTDYFIGNIYILSDVVDPITTDSLVTDDIYTNLFQTELGQSLNENSKNAFWIGSNKFLDENLNTDANDYSLRLVRNVKEMNAVLVIDIKFSSVEEILNNLDFDKSGIIGLVTSDGREIILKNELSVDESTDNTSKLSSVNDFIYIDKEFYKTAVASNELNGSQYVTLKGKEYLFMYTKIGETGSVICALMPKKTIMKQTDLIKRITVIIIIGASIIAGVIGLSISNGINVNIKNIISKLKQASEGDLTVEFKSKQNDEFHILTNEIQSTFLNVKNLISQVKDLSNDVSESSTKVTKASNIFSKTTEHISQSMNEIEIGVMQQAQDAEQCLLLMDNLSNRIVLVSDNTKEIDLIANSTRESICVGTETTEELNRQTKSTMDITKEIIQEIENLAERSSSISKVINVINDIANQTNLLSLNASIEAARAGDAGKGFAVVASEIRNLADQSKSSVSDIKNIIEKINNDTKKVVETATNAQEVMNLQESVVKRTSESYKNINNNVEKLVDNLQQISENVESIEKARVNTLGAIESISAVLEEVAASTNSVNQTSNEQLQSVGDLNLSADKLNNNANKLVKAIQIFKI